MSAPKFKFPRVESGLYQIVKDKVTVGLIQKQVDDKEVSWWIYNTTDPQDIGPSNAVGNPDELLREAKETAQKYFATKTSVNEESSVTVDTVVQQKVVEEKGILDDMNTEEDFFDSLNEFEEFESDFDMTSVEPNLVNV
jgi:hypothetical protein